MIDFFAYFAGKRDREALEWVQVLHSDDMSDTQMEAYVAWMEANPRNAEAFRALDEVWVASGDASDAIHARFGPEARDATGASLFTGKLRAALQPAWTPQFAGAVAAICVIAVLALQWPQPAPQSQRFATAIGDLLDVSLADGSVVTLNTGSEIVVAFSEDKRVVSLERGGALFDVMPDAERPFQVRMNGGAVEVLGTVFDVLRDPDGFSVTVLEGRVSVSAEGEDPDLKAVVLNPNQRVEVITKLASLTSFTIDADMATAWHRGQLIYRDAVVADVMTDLNRYSTVPLSIENAGIEQSNFTGVLTIDAPNIMMERLASLLQMEVVQSEEGGLRLQSIN